MVATLFQLDFKDFELSCHGVRHFLMCNSIYLK